MKTSSTPIGKQVVLISGAARGIGRAIAERLAQEGYGLALNDINGELLGDTTQALRQKGAEFGCLGARHRDN